MVDLGLQGPIMVGRRALIFSQMALGTLKLRCTACNNWSVIKYNMTEQTFSIQPVIGFHGNSEFTQVW